MALQDVFRNNFKDWFHTIEEVEEKELSENIENYNKIYTNFQKVHKLFLVADESNVLWIPGIKKSVQDKNCAQKIYIYEVK